MQVLWSKADEHNLNSDLFSLFLQATSKDVQNKNWSFEEMSMLSDMLSVMILSIEENLRYNTRAVISGNLADDNKSVHYSKEQSGKPDEGAQLFSRESPKDIVNHTNLSGCAWFRLAALQLLQTCTHACFQQRVPVLGQGKAQITNTVDIHSFLPRSTLAAPLLSIIHFPLHKVVMSPLTCKMSQNL